MNILYLIVALIGAGAGAFFVWKYKTFQVEKLNNEIRRQNREFELQTQFILQEREKEIKRIDNEIHYHREQLEKTIEQEASIAKTISEQEIARAREAFAAYMATLDSHYIEIESEFDNEISKLQEELNKLKSMRDASIQAALREKEIQEQQEFYKISIGQGDLEDIKILENIKPKLRKPEILSKLIWTTYYQKNVNTLCSNIIGEKVVCGIYKITDTTTGLAYIGQSVNIAQRWKDHIKNALGAGSRPGNNKLYETMQKNGVYNFTFEILEEVPAEYLNEKEKYYIEFYQSSIFGLNTMKGNG